MGNTRVSHPQETPLRAGVQEGAPAPAPALQPLDAGPAPPHCLPAVVAAHPRCPGPLQRGRGSLHPGAQHHAASLRSRSGSSRRGQCLLTGKSALLRRRPKHSLHPSSNSHWSKGGKCHRRWSGSCVFTSQQLITGTFLAAASHRGQSCSAAALGPAGCHHRLCHVPVLSSGYFSYLHLL